MAYRSDVSDIFAELSSALAHPEFYEYNNIPGWGEHYKTLALRTKDGLRELATQLKAAQAAGDVERFKLMKDVREQLCLWWMRKKLLEWSTSEEDNDLWEFHDSGLTDAVLDVASDERIYVQGNEEEVNYFHHVYSSLHACLCGYFRVVRRWRRKHLKSTKYYLERTNKLYITLWRRREQTLDYMSDALWDEGEGVETTTFLRLVDVATTINQLHYVCYNQIQSLNYGRAYHITMYVWMHTRDIWCTEAAWKLYTVGVGAEGPLLNRDGPNDNVGLRQFLTEAVVNVNQEEALITKMTFIMFHPVVIDKALMEYMSGLRAMTIVCRPVLHFASLDSEVLLELRNACSVACQRQTCSGGEIAPGVMYEIFQIAFDMISTTLRDLLEVARQDNLTQDQATKILQEIIRIKFMPLFQRLLHLPAFEERATSNFLSCIFNPLLLLRNTMSARCLSQSRARATDSLIRNVVETTRTVWYPILTRLRQLKAMRDPREETPGFLVELWEQYGQACGLSLSDRLTREPVPWGSHLLTLQNHSSVKMGCSLDSCMCVMAPSHKMKVCKRCWRAFYCNSRCQAQDWLAGHRDVCVRP